MPPPIVERYITVYFVQVIESLDVLWWSCECTNWSVSGRIDRRSCNVGLWSCNVGRTVPGVGGDSCSLGGSGNTASLRLLHDSASTNPTHCRKITCSWGSRGHACHVSMRGNEECSLSRDLALSAPMVAAGAAISIQPTEWQRITSSWKHARFNCMWSIKLHFRVTLIYCHLRKTMYRREPIKVQSACIGEQMRLYM